MSTARPPADAKPVDATVLGAGPAGAAAALGLRRLGYRVAILGRPRAAAMEGLSARTIARLAAAQLHAAADCARMSSPRIAFWAGRLTAHGAEFLVERSVFDRALAVDLAAGGIQVMDLPVISVTPEPSGFRIVTAGGVIRSRAVLEARGRLARRADECGPRLVAWIERCRSAERRMRGSAVVALDDGWCWLAADGTGTLQRQFVCAARRRYSTAELRERLDTASAAISALDFSTRGATLIDRVRARAAVARFSHPARVPGVIRVGDAALAMDPLSGQGVHEALASAHVAVAAVNSFLRGADWAPIARFVDERCAEVWRRGLATAGAFYRDHARCGAGSTADFWDSTAQAYERLAAAAGPREDGPGRFELRPVLCGMHIELHPVWVSSKWPRGIWRIAARDSGLNRHDAQASAAFTREVRNDDGQAAIR